MEPRRQWWGCQRPSRLEEPLSDWRILTPVWSPRGPHFNTLALHNSLQTPVLETLGQIISKTGIQSRPPKEKKREREKEKKEKKKRGNKKYVTDKGARKKPTKPNI